MTQAIQATSGRRVVATLFLTMLGVFVLIGASLLLQQPSGNIDPAFLREGRFHGAWAHAGDPERLREWNIDWTDVLFLVDEPAEDGGTPLTGTMIAAGRRARFELDTTTDAAGGTLVFEDPGPGIDAPGVLENRILIDLDGSRERAKDYLYLGFGRGKHSKVVKMLTFRRAE